MSRFDYVKFDQRAIEDQNFFKSEVEELEKTIDLNVKCPRSKALAMTKLEEVYMWIGKGIRNDQLERTRIYDSERNK